MALWFILGSVGLALWLARAVRRAGLHDRSAAESEASAALDGGDPRPPRAADPNGRTHRMSPSIPFGVPPLPKDDTATDERPERDR